MLLPDGIEPEDIEPCAGLAGGGRHIIFIVSQISSYGQEGCSGPDLGLRSLPFLGTPHSVFLLATALQGGEPTLAEEWSGGLG